MRAYIVKGLIIFFAWVVFLGCAVPLEPQKYQPNVSISKHFDKTIEVIVDKTKNVLDMDFDSFVCGLTTKTIKDTKLFSQVIDNSADVKLVIHIVTVNNPIIGLSLESQVEIAWILLKKDKILFRKSFITSGYATSKEVSYGKARIIVATQRAIQKNIEQALTQISKLDIK